MACGDAGDSRVVAHQPDLRRARNRAPGCGTRPVTLHHQLVPYLSLRPIGDLNLQNQVMRRPRDADV